MTDTGVPTVQGVVLAGGESTRFGEEDKALATFEGRPLLARVCRTLRTATGLAPVIAAGDEERAESLARRLDQWTDSIPPIVTDHPDFEGPVAGLVGACEASEADWLFVSGCDMPRLDGNAITWLYERAPVDATAVVPQRDAGLEPTHALYRRSAVTSATEAIPPTVGLHRLLAAMDAVETFDAERWPASVHESLTDVNTVADLRALEERSVDVSDPDRD